MKRNSLTIVTVIVLCCAILVGGTLAYLNDYDKKDNPFVYDSTGGTDPGNKNFGIKLEELSWDADNAEDFTPGRAIPKDPTVTVIGKNDAFVGIMLTTVARTHPEPGTTGTNVELAKLKSDIFDIDFDTTNWELVHSDTAKNTEYWVCKTSMKKDDSATLFTKMTVKNDANEKLLATDCWDLQVHAFAVQSEKPANWDTENPGVTWNANNALRAEFATGGVNTAATVRWEAPAN